MQIDGINVQRNAPTSLDEAVQELSEVYSVFSSGTRVCFENIADPEYPDASVTGVSRERFTPAIEDFVNGLGSRQYLISEGHCVVSERYRAEVESYANYLEASGLLPKGSLDNVVWVNSSTETLAVLSVVAELGLEVVPYCQRAELLELADTVGASVLSSPHHVAEDVVERFYSKKLYRDWVQDRFGEEAIPFPRVSIGEKYGFDATRFDHALDYALRYDRQFGDGAEPLLFMQSAKSGGGLGNMRVMAHDDGRFSITSGLGDPITFANRDEMLEFVEVRSKSEVFDITPYVPVTQSYTLAMMVSDSAVTVLGPLDQLLAEGTNDYSGWKCDVESREGRYADLDKQLRMATAYGLTLHDQGYRGWADEDLFEFIAPDGTTQVSRSESNIRRDGMTHLIGTVLRDDRLRESFVEGRLSLMQRDHFEISIEGGSADACDIAARVLDAGIPLVTAGEPDSSPYGLLFMSAFMPVAEGTKASACIAIIAPTDELRDEWDSKFRELFSPHAT